jgi:DNA-binding NtrC family response regulator
MRQRILILTENQFSFAEIERLLNENGYHVDIVRNAEQAIELIRQADFSVVIAPFRMRGTISGLHVLTEHELISPGKGKILVLERWSKNIATIANYIGAICVRPAISAKELFEKIESLLVSAKRA